jgi:carboxylate-amine ligase
MLEFLDDVVDELGTRAEVEYAQTILEGGSSADRQLRVYRETGDILSVVHHLVRETAEGCCDEPRSPRRSGSPGAPRRRARGGSARRGEMA